MSKPEATKTPMPFARFEWMIAWRYLRAKRAEGGVSVMTWISLIGITLAVFALIATLAVRSGFRTDFVGTILGANAHVTVYKSAEADEYGRLDRKIYDYDEMAARLLTVEGVTRAAPLVRGQVMGNKAGRNTGVRQSRQRRRNAHGSIGRPRPQALLLAGNKCTAGGRVGGCAMHR